jgi:hypothetical protein
MKSFLAASCIVHVHALQLMILAGAGDLSVVRDRGWAGSLILSAVMVLFVSWVVALVSFGICFLKMCHVRRAIGTSAYLMPRELNFELWNPMSDIEKSWVRAYALSIVLLMIVPPACGTFPLTWTMAGMTGSSYIFACYSARIGTPSKRAPVRPNPLRIGAV